MKTLEDILNSKFGSKCPDFDDDCIMCEVCEMYRDCTKAIKEAFEAVEVYGSYESKYGGGEFTAGYNQAIKDQKEKMENFLK